MQTEKDRIRACLGAVAADTQAIVAALEDAQNVARLRNLKSRQRIEEGKDSVVQRVLDGGRRKGPNPGRAPIFLAALVLGYLVGAIPVGYLVARTNFIGRQALAE